MPLESFQNLFNWNPPFTKEYIGDGILLPKTKLCIFSAPKMYKSLLATQLGFCLAAGLPWIGFTTTKSKVALLQSEIPKTQFRQRMIAMYQGGNIQLQPHEFLVDTVPKFKLDNAKDITRLKDDLILHRPDILILDPWYKMLTVEDNRSYSFTQDVMDGIIEDFNLSIVVIHHDTKPQFDPTSGGYSTSRWPRGPRTVEGWFDTIISMGGDLDTDLRELRFEARHATRLIYPIQIELNRAKLWMVRK